MTREKDRAVVSHLIGRVVGTRGAGPFQMPDQDRRIIDHATTRLADPQAEVGVFVIGGRIASIESAKCLPQRRSHGEKCARAEIDFANKAEFGGVGILTAAIADRGAVAERDTAGLLQPPVGQHDTGADGADGRIRLQTVERGAQRALLHDGVVIQEQDIAAAGARRALIGGGEEMPVLVVAQDRGAIDPREQHVRLVGRMVVDDDRFESDAVLIGERG